jgi:predicted ATPase
VKAMSVEQINARIADMFRLLTGGSRTALPRQQTLRAAIDWSYDLLSEKEKILLRRLSVFAGGWTLEAAEQVCADPEE